MRCEECNIEMRVDKATHENPYQFDRCGLDDVYLIGIERHTCPKCNALYPIIPRIQELHTEIASILIEKASALTGQEIRYLRRWIGVEAQVFANLLGLRPEHLSKVENNRLKLGTAAERLVRIFAMTHKRERKFQDISRKVQGIKDARQRARLRRRCQFSGTRWKVEDEAQAA
jgi:DNA-binding transcriptional regulator YiaG